MLNNKNKNEFLNVLSNIDDDLIQFVLDKNTEESLEESSQKAKIIIPRSKRPKPLQQIAPLAASLALIVFVGIGSLIIGSQPSSPGGEKTDITACSSGTSLTEQYTSSTEAVTDTETTTTETITISPPYGTHHPRPIGEEHIPNIDGYSVDLDNPHNEFLDSVIFDTKYYGDYKVSLIGYEVFTDFENAGENIVFAHKLEIQLYIKDELIDFRSAYNPLTPDAPLKMLKMGRLDCYLELIGTENGQYNSSEECLIIFRSLNINENSPIPEVLFYFASNGKLLDCERRDLTANRAERSEALSARVSIEKNDEFYTVYDNLTCVTYTFTLIGDKVEYTEGRIGFSKFKDSLETTFDPDSLPVIDEFTYDESKEICDMLSPPTVISQKNVGEYTLSLIGMNMRRTEDGQILFYNPKTVIFRNDEYIGEITTTFEQMTSCHACIMHPNDYNAYDQYALEAQMMNDVLLVIDKGGLSDSYFGTGCFYAVRDSQIYSLDGYWPGMTDTDPPLWTENQEGYDLIVDAKTQSVIFGFMKYEFNFEVLPAMYNYKVSWLAESDKIIPFPD